MHAKIQTSPIHLYLHPPLMKIKKIPSLREPSLDSTVAIRLISTTSLRLHVMRWSSILLSIIHARLLTRMIARLLNTLVSTSRDKFLSIISTSVATGFVGVVIRSTAADGEHPEETASDAECDCEPSCSEERGVDCGFGTVGFGDGIDGCGDDGGFDCGHDGCCDDGCG